MYQEVIDRYLNESLLPEPPVAFKDKLLQGQEPTLYEDILAMKLSRVGYINRQLKMLKDDFHRIQERYYEQKYFLPKKYLRGLFFYKPPSMNVKQFVQLIAQSYERQNIERMIVTAINLSHYNLLKGLHSEQQAFQKSIELKIGAILPS